MQNPNLVGSHYVLTLLPVWASSLIVYGATLGAIYVLRDVFEGVPYQVAYSAQIGDAGLAGIVLIAATILQRGGALPTWLAGSHCHLMFATAGVIVGIVWWLADRTVIPGDMYHHLVVAPLFIYLAGTLLPVVFVNGTTAEKLWTLVFGIVWLGAVWFDVISGRMSQRIWLMAHGLKFKI